MGRGVVIVLLVLSGIIFTLSVLLMSPKGGLGMGIAGVSGGSGDYGSKKSIESTLKKSAVVAGVVFMVSVVMLPYIR